MGSEKHIDLPMDSHTHTASTHHCGKCCGTTWRGPGRLQIWPCIWGKAATLCPGMHSPIRKQQRSNATSCCLHLHKHTNRIHTQVLLRLFSYMLYFAYIYIFRCPHICMRFLYLCRTEMINYLMLKCALFPFLEYMSSCYMLYHI